MDLDAWILQLKRCEILKEEQVKLLCERAVEIFVEEGNVQRVEAPVTICKPCRLERGYCRVHRVALPSAAEPQAIELGRNAPAHPKASPLHPWSQAATSMDSFMTCWSCSRSGATAPRRVDHGHAWNMAGPGFCLGVRERGRGRAPQAPARAAVSGVAWFTRPCPRPAWEAACSRGCLRR